MKFLSEMFEGIFGFFLFILCVMTAICFAILAVKILVYIVVGIVWFIIQAFDLIWGNS